MKKIFILFLLLILPLAVTAHETKRAGTLDILLHMEPLDNPAVGEDAFLYFSVADSQNKFSFKDCDCRVAVKDSSGAELLNRALSVEDEAPDWGVNVSRVGFVFPHLGIYKVSIQGQSKSGLYGPFQLEYDKRIERENVEQSLVKNEPIENSPWYTNYYVIGGIVLVSGIIISELYSKLRKKKKK